MFIYSYVYVYAYSWLKVRDGESYSGGVLQVLGPLQQVSLSLQLIGQWAFALELISLPLMALPLWGLGHVGCL